MHQYMGSDVVTVVSVMLESCAVSNSVVYNVRPNMSRGICYLYHQC